MELIILFRVLVFVLVGLFWVKNAMCGMMDFVPFFDIDLEKDVLPSTEELEEVLAETEEYDKKYDNLYDLRGDFNQEFGKIIAAYGMQEKRLKPNNEDYYLSFLKMMPSLYYQYIGPQLFEVPNMSEKILNLPGIKETKNKFPTRIAEQVRDVENLEFLSPMYYFLLMPEAWTGLDAKIEYPKKVKGKTKVAYDKNFYRAIKKIIKPEKFMPGYKDDGKKTKSDLRTLMPDKNSLLTNADIKVFMGTVDEVNDWANKFENKLALSRTTILLANYDRKDPVGKYVPAGLKDLVHPCARFVQKIRILGKEKEVAAIVAKDGFTLNEWAYTCDKTIKAYKLANIRPATLSAVLQFQRGLHDDVVEGVSLELQKGRFAAMAALVEAHKAPLSDVVEYGKSRMEFENLLFRHKYNLFGQMVELH